MHLFQRKKLTSIITFPLFAVSSTQSYSIDLLENSPTKMTAATSLVRLATKMWTVII